MSRQGWNECLAWAETDGTALTATSQASLLPPPALYTTPTNFWDVGKKLRITAGGRISNIITTPGTLTFQVMAGPTSNIAVFNAGAVQLNAVAQTNVSWWLDLLLTCRAVGTGTAANVLGMGLFTSQAIVGGGTGVAGTATAGGAGTSSYSQVLPQTAPAVGTGFSSIVSSIIDLQGVFSLTGNSLTLHQYSLYAEN